jgi:hypothetical protein
MAEFDGSWDTLPAWKVASELCQCPVEAGGSSPAGAATLFEAEEVAGDVLHMLSLDMLNAVKRDSSLGAVCSAFRVIGEWINANPLTGFTAPTLAEARAQLALYAPFVDKVQEIRDRQANLLPADPPPELVCSLSGMLMDDPVRLDDGQVYDCFVITFWHELQRQGKPKQQWRFTSPVTGAIVTTRQRQDDHLNILISNYFKATTHALLA